MPGIISTIFDSDGEGAQQGAQATSISGDGETGAEASPEVTIGMSGSHQNADGSTSEWSNETRVGTDVDLDVAAATATSLTQGESEDFG